MELKALVDELEGVQKLLSENDSIFAGSMIKQFRTKGKLSDKQFYWVGKLIEKAITPAQEKPVDQIGTDFTTIYSMFLKAKEHLKYPKLHFTVDGCKIVMQMSGANSKVPGVINLTDGQPFGQNKWFGRLYQDGRWEKPLKDVEGSGIVRKLLQELASDPAGTAEKYSKLAGACCFCSTPLTAEQSVGYGYGPVCAKKWGMPYSTKKGDM